MAKPKTIIKKLKNIDNYEFTPENLGIDYSYKIYASLNGNKINDAVGNDYLIGSKGNDILIAGKGNDTISGGLGINTLKITGDASGNDTLMLGKGTDNLIFDTSNSFSYSKSGNNLIINHKKDAVDNGEITVKNYFKSKEGQASLKTLNENNLNTLINAQGLILNDTTVKNKKITGTYLNDLIIAQGDTKNTITTDKGNDTITAGLNNDTITINGTGKKTIKIKKGDGDDTIIFKKEGLKSKVVLAFDYNQSNPDYTDYEYSKDKNNLLIKRSWQESESVTKTETTIIKDYFKYEPNISLTRFDTDEESVLTDILHSETFIFNFEDQAKPVTVDGTRYDDVFRGGTKADKITTGYGDDIIYGNKGNDKITINGEGRKDIHITRQDGNDVILLDLDKVPATEKINVNIILDDPYGLPTTTYSIAKNKKDIIITNAYNAVGENKAVTQTITVKNYFGNTNKVNLKVGETNVYTLLSENKGEVVTKGSNITGTLFDDSIQGTEKADVIYGLSGNDTITASRGNDKIYGGDGNDVYIYSEFDENGDDTAYYHDTIYGGNGVDVIRFTNLRENFGPSNINNNYTYFQTSASLYTGPFPMFLTNQDGCTYVKKGNDLIIGAFQGSTPADVVQVNYNKITLKDYFKSAKGEYSVKYIENAPKIVEDSVLIDNPDYTQLNLADDMVVEHSWRTTNLISDHKANKYTGTVYNDYIEGAYKQDIFRGGDGNDVIDGMVCAKGKDYLYGDAGNDLIIGNDAYMFGGTGNDTYTSYTQDNMKVVSSVISDESGYDTVALPFGTYMTYFDVTQKNGQVASTGDMYIKDTTLSTEKWTQYGYRLLEDPYTVFYDDNPNLLDVRDDIQKYTIHNLTTNTDEWQTQTIGNKAFEVGLDDTVLVTEYGNREVQGQINILKSDVGFVIKNGTKKESAIEHYTIGYNTIFYEDKGFATLYNQDKINNTAQQVATWLNENSFSSVQDAIKKGTKEQLGTMLNIFKNNMFAWSDVNYIELSGNQNNNEYWEGTGTTYISDDFWEGHKYNTEYTLHITNNDLYSIINDYNGTDTLILDSCEGGYSFLFDVEVDEKGNLLNYSRDFYVKFAGKEAEETGVTINCGREKNHAIEEIYIGENKIFQYNEEIINEVRQNVAGWLADSGYASVQDVLHCNDADIVAEMMTKFAPIKNLTP